MLLSLGVWQGEPCDLKKFGDQLRSTFVPNTCIIDCTASDVPASNYLSWMQKVAKFDLQLSSKDT
jgi:hypothetical protein